MTMSNYEAELKSELEYADECIARLKRILEAIDAEGRSANADGDVIIPSHVWDMVRAELEPEKL